ncbi:MAG: hypothetical protein ACYC8T_20385 [Myxococcaceae bacterium]
MAASLEALTLRLAALRLLKPAAEAAEEEPERASSRPRELQGQLLKLCHEGRLEGGLCVSLRVRPDELVGPLTHELGGAARKLKVLDVRGDAPVELTVHFGETTERWELEDLAALVHNLNDLYRGDAQVKVAAVLGEWEDMLQLWCVSKEVLSSLLRERFFEPRNRAQLEAIAP